MVNNTQNPFILVVCLFIAGNASAGTWVDWKPVKEKVSQGVSKIVKTAENIKKSVIRKKEEVQESFDDEVSPCQSISLLGVDTVRVSGSGSLVITQDRTENEELVIECSNGELAEVDVRVENNTLVLVLKNKNSLLSGKLTYHANINDLSQIDIADSAYVELHDLNISELSVRASGKAKIAGDVFVNTLNVDLSDAATMILSGFADKQRVRISGKSFFDGQLLEGNSMFIDGSGSSYIYSNISDVIEGMLLDSGSLMYMASPVVAIDSSSTAFVTKL